MTDFKLNFASKFFVIFAALLTWGGYSITANASQTYYYKAHAEISPTGAGTVYISDNNAKPTTYSDIDDSNGKEVTGSIQSTPNPKIYLWAEPKEGYTFLNWTGKGEKDNETIVFDDATSPTTTCQLNGCSTASGNVTKYTIYANFVKPAVIVSSTGFKGKVSISNASNDIGDEVTLTAKPFTNELGAKFKYWQCPDGSIVTDNPYTFTIDKNNQGTYTAVSTDTKYYQLKNCWNNHIFGIYGSSGTGTNYNSRGYERCISYSLMSANDNDAVHASPAFVMEISGNLDNKANITNVDLHANGASLNEALTNFAQWTLKKHSITSDGKTYEPYLEYDSVGNDRGHVFLMTVQGIGSAEFSEDGYRAQPVEVFGSVQVPAMINYANRGSLYNNCLWKLLPFTEESSDAYFGPLPTANQKFGDRYYTTMYTVFPYKCLDDVKAYTVSDLNEDGTLKLDEITSGIVPANTPVILASKTLKPKTNRLLPLIHDVDAFTGTNLLKGEVWIMKDETADPSTYRTAFDASTMRVLSSTEGTFKNENNKGYYVTYPFDSSAADKAPTGTANTVFPYIVNNTAYLSTENMTDAQKALFAQHDTWKLFPDKAELSIDGDNGSADNWASVNASKVADVTLTRSMANDGGWYSLCLPFDINATDLKAAFGDDVDLEELSEATSSDNNVSVTFKKVDALTAGKPYLIKLSKDFTTYTFNDVTVYGDDVTPEDFGNGYTFQGTKQFNAEDIRANYGTRARFLGGSDGLSLKTPSKSSKPLKPTRCFFVYPENASSAKSMTFTMGGQDTPTAIEHITLDDIDRDIQRPVDNRIYSLTGQYVGTDFSSLPKGIYIVNGKKVMK